MESRSGLRDLWSTSGLDRTAAFSDAVLAIAMTILVLDLKAPDVAGRHEYDAALLAALPQFYGFALSFGLLCLLWMAHHARLSALKRIDAGLLGSSAGATARPSRRCSTPWPCPARGCA